MWESSDLGRVYPGLSRFMKEVTVCGILRIFRSEKLSHVNTPAPYTRGIDEGLGVQSLFR